MGALHLIVVKINRNLLVLTNLVVTDKKYRVANSEESLGRLVSGKEKSGRRFRNFGGDGAEFCLAEEPMPMPMFRMINESRWRRS